MKRAIQAVLISVATAAAFFAVFVAAAIVVPQDQQAIRQHLVDAIISGEMNEQTDRFQKYPVHRNVFNCLLFNMMLAPGSNPPVEAISNRMAAVDDVVYHDRVPPFPDCQAMWRALPELGGIGARFIQYNRYILGMRVVGRVMLSSVSVKALRHILLGISYALIGLIGAAALYRLSRANDAAERARAAGYAAIAACLTLFYGVYYFDSTLNFAPMDWVQFVFILLSLVWPLAEMRPAGLAAFAASYGSAIAIFEFLTGGIPLALGLLPLLLALGFRGDRSEYFGKVIRLWACFAIAVVAMFAIKKIYTVVLLGDSEGFFSALFVRIYGTFDSGTTAQYTFSYLVITYYAASAVIAWGLRHVAPVLVTASVIAIAVSTWRGRKTIWSPRHVMLWACWLALFAEAAWIGVFLNHALLHSTYMARLLVVPITAAAVLIVTDAISRRARQDSARLATD
jgi:hypothetical protein